MRVYGRVTEKPVEEPVQLRDERVNVERRAVDRPVTDVDRQDEVVVEITEMKTYEASRAGEIRQARSKRQKNRN